MKRTAMTSLMASTGRLSSLVGGVRRRPLWLAGAFVLCGLAMFLLGRSTAPTPGDLTAAVNELQLQLLLQQGAVDRLAANNRQGTNALAARLAELQAASTRLDALGELKSNSSRESWAPRARTNCATPSTRWPPS